MTSTVVWSQVQLKRVLVAHVSECCVARDAGLSPWACRLAVSLLRAVAAGDRLTWNGNCELVWEQDGNRACRQSSDLNSSQLTLPSSRGWFAPWLSRRRVRWSDASAFTRDPMSISIGRFTVRDVSQVLPLVAALLGYLYVGVRVRGVTWREGPDRGPADRRRQHTRG